MQNYWSMIELLLWNELFTRCFHQTTNSESFIKLFYCLERLQNNIVDIYGIRFSWKHVEHKQLKFPPKFFFVKYMFLTNLLNRGKRNYSPSQNRTGSLKSFGSSSGLPKTMAMENTITTKICFMISNKHQIKGGSR